MNSVAIETTVPAGPSSLASSTWCMYSVVSPCRCVRQWSQCRWLKTRYPEPSIKTMNRPSSRATSRAFMRINR